MKLPNNQLQSLKLQKITPLKRSLARLSRGKLFKSVRSQSSQKVIQKTSQKSADKSTASSAAASSTSVSSAPSIQGNSLVTSIEAAKSSKSFRVALNLLLVRPWILVAGFWLFSMVGGTLALNGMLSPRKLTMALPEPAIVEAPVALSSNIAVTPDSDEQLPSEADQPEVISIGGGDAESGENTSRFPLLPLTILVGGCATGCLIVSRRRAMARMAAARARGRARIRKGGPVRAGQTGQPVSKSVQKGPVVKANTSKANTSKGKGLKKRRQRVRKTAVSKPAAAPNQVLASRATAQPAASQPRTAKSRTSQPRSASPTSQSRASKRQVRRASMRAASRRQPIVSVVPANESHSLDWSNGSLAHQMDVRPHRSAM